MQLGRVGDSKRGTLRVRARASRFEARSRVFATNPYTAKITMMCEPASNGQQIRSCNYNDYVIVPSQL